METANGEAPASGRGFGDRDVLVWYCCRVLVGCLLAMSVQIMAMMAQKSISRAKRKDFIVIVFDNTTKLMHTA